VSELEEAYRHLIAGRLEEAKAVLGANPRPKEGYRLGVRVALEGILRSLGRRKGRNVIDNLSRMVDLVKARLESGWLEEFDQGFFETWLRFLEDYGKVAKNRVL
jgi:hypothetical protein